MRRRDAAFLAALFLASLALRPQLVGIGPLLPRIQDDLGLSHVVAGLLATIPVVCLGAFAPVGRFLAPWGARRIVALALVAIVAFGLARAVALGAAGVIVLTVPVGIAMALAGAILPVAVKERLPHRPAFATGVYATGIQSGAILAGAVSVPVAHAAGGWRASLGVFSVATVVLLAAWLALTPASARVAATVGAARLPLRSGLVWMVVAVFGLQGILYHGLNAWLPGVYADRGWSELRAGALVAVLNLAALPGSLVLPWFADRVGSRRAYLAGAALVAVAACLGLLLGPALGWVWAALAGFALSALFAFALTLPLDIAGDSREVAAVVGVTLGAGYLLSALGPLLFGAVRDASGTFDASLWLFAAVSLALLAAVVPLSRERLASGLGTRPPRSAPS